MRIRPVITGIVTCAVLAAATSCKKQQEPAPAPEPPKTAEVTASNATQVVDTAKTTARQLTEQATEQSQTTISRITTEAAARAKTTAGQVTNETSAASKAAEQKAQRFLDQAKTLIASGSYADALNALRQAAAINLTAEQQKMMDDLKTQIEKAETKATADDAASALGGALGGKK